MTTIVTRQQKGSPLTDAELDANFTNLNSAKLEDGNVRSLTNPSLVLDFTNDVLDPRISFTRSSTGTYTNDYGVLSTAATNTARFDYDPITREPKGLLIEEQRTNILTYSQNFENPAWTKNELTVNSNVITAPDGTLSGTNLILSANAAQHYLRNPVVVTAISYTFSIYAKNGGYNYIAITSTGYNACFDLTLETVSATSGSDGVSTITPVGNGWYRCSVSVTERARTNSFFVSPRSTNGSAISNTAGDGVSGVYVWGAQLEAGAFATTYIPTFLTYSGRGSSATYANANNYIVTAAPNVPRYVTNSLGGQQLLLEGAASNLIQWTNRFSQWSSSANVYVIENATTAPDGTYTADLVAAPSTASAFGIFQTFISGVTSGSNYTFSVYAKAGASPKMSIRSISNTADAGRIIDLTTGTVGATITNTDFVSCVVTPSVNGWYRIALTIVARTTTANIYLYCEDVNSAPVTGGVYFWGAQLESGSVATSYIPSTESFTSRSANATFYDASTTALAEQNLALYSQQFDQSSTWNTTLTNVVSDYAFAPDFSPTSDLISFNDAGSYIYQTINTGLITGKTYTFSCWLWSQGGKSNVGMRMTANSQANDETYSTISLNSVLTRFSITRTFTSSDTSIRIGFDNRVTQGGDAIVGNFIAWGAQLEQRTSATAYTPTTSVAISNTIPRMLTASANTARYDFDPVTRLYKGLILEPAATNLLYYSQTFSNVAYWSFTRSSYLAGATIAPDGTQTAYKLIEDSTPYNTHDIRFSQAKTASSIQYTYSIYVKSAERSQFCIWLYGASQANRVEVYFDINAGTIVSQTLQGTGWTTPSSYITPVGNGWYRCSVTGLSNTDTIVGALVSPSQAGYLYYNGNGWSGLYLWGAQMEVGSVATSYIPTLGSQVTRTADIGTSVAQSRAADIYSSAQATRTADFVSMTGNNVSSWYNIQNGTFYTEAERRNNVDPSTNFHVFTISDGTNQNYYKIRFVGTTYVTQTYCVSKGVPQFGAGINGSIPSLGEYKKCALSIGSSSAFYDTGTSRGSSSGVSIPVNINKMAIGSEYTAGSQFLNGCIKRIVYYPKQLTNNELISITTP